MKLSFIISNRCIDYYLNKIPTWLKPGDKVRDLVNGRIHTVGRTDQNNSFKSYYDGIQIWASEFFEKVDN